MPVVGESSAPSVLRMVDESDTQATNFQPRERHLLAPEHDLESLEDDGDDDDSEEFRSGAFAVSQEGHVTKQHKGIHTLATSTPHTIHSTTGESSGGRPS
jgi:hypothetical protein